MCLSRVEYYLVIALTSLAPLFCEVEAPALAEEVSYLSFQVPGAEGTYPMSVNNAMAVTGYYYTSPTLTRGFVREPDGAITTFSVGAGIWTEPESINNAGDIAGFYEDVAGVPRGFVRRADGRVIKFDPPHNPRVGPQSQPVSINDYGVIAGNYPFPLNGLDGFLRSATGAFTNFEVGQGGADYETIVTALNANGTAAGFYEFSAGGFGGFLTHPDGFSVEFAVFDNFGGNGYGATIPQSVNAAGAIAGWYTSCINPCTTTSTGGFVRSPEGVITVFSPPGTIVTVPQMGYRIDDESLTAPHRLGINQEGSIAGSYVDTTGAQHGFLRNPFGTITPFDPPRGEHTTATSINDNGVIVGYYLYDWNSQIPQAFLRIPKP